MTREQGQIVRLLLMCAAWAIGQTLTIGLGAGVVDFVVPAALAVGVYLVTEDLARPRYSGGNVKYWRGRPVDDEDRGPGRWN